jgi:hypothetical protein
MALTFTPFAANLGKLGLASFSGWRLGTSVSWQTFLG